MLKSNIQSTNKNVNILIKDAQTLFHDAATLTGEKAVEARQRAMNLLDVAIANVHDAQANVMVAGKEMATSADHYVKENPWKVIGAVAGFGLLLGVILSRK